jgi:methyl-accepting chemotaxis protein
MRFGLRRREGHELDLANVITNLSTSALVVDRDFVIRHISDTLLDTLGYERAEVVGKLSCAQINRTPLCGTAECTLHKAMQTHQEQIAHTSAHSRDGKELAVRAISSALFDGNDEPIGGVELLIDETDQRATLHALRSLAQAISAGDLAQRTDPEIASGAYSDLLRQVNSMIDTMAEPFRDASRTLNQIAAGDLRARMKGNTPGEFATLKNSLNLAAGNLDTSLSQVHAAAEQVTMAAKEIASGSQSLAEGASEQASAVEEISASLGQMTSSATQNAEFAKQARGTTDSARNELESSMSEMQTLANAMEAIQESANRTATIVKEIDEIAFQTNLLALNAAVEAARAGEAGKGFAVVAEEVRNLAIRSADSAKGTAELIGKAVQNTAQGVALTQEVLRSLSGIRQRIQEVGGMMQEITQASTLQQGGVSQISSGVSQVSDVTQQTASASEESAAAAQELLRQAESLRELTEGFSLSTGSTPAPGLRIPSNTPSAISQEQADLNALLPLKALTSF